MLTYVILPKITHAILLIMTYGDAMIIMTGGVGGKVHLHRRECGKGQRVVGMAGTADGLMSMRWCMAPCYITNLLF